MKSQFDLTGKVIVVTGGSGLLGSQFVEAIRAQGAVAIAADIEPKGKHGVALDITSKTSVVSAIESISKQHGRIDALVNNAYPRNKNYGRHFFDVEYEDFSENLSLHLGGYFLCSQQFAKFFKTQGQGSIVNISSIYGLNAPRFEIYEGTTMTTPVEYAAIKSGLNHLTRYMAAYLKGSGIRVNTLSLGGILDSQPESFLKNYKNLCTNKGMLEPNDVIGSLLFLLSDAAEFVNGHNLVVDDGFSL